MTVAFKHDSAAINHIQVFNLEDFRKILLHGIDNPNFFFVLFAVYLQPLSPGIHK